MFALNRHSLVFVCIGLLLSACHTRNSQDAVRNGFPVHARGSIAQLSPISGSFNIDGDDRPDSIFYDFTGGAHCCYRVFLKLDEVDSLYQVPLLIEGGYLFGLDLSRPQSFNVGDFDGDGLAEISVQKPGITGNVEKDLKNAKSWIVDYENGRFAIREMARSGK